MDVVLILDSSSNVAKADYKKLLQYLQNLVGQVSVSVNKVRMGVIVYSKSSKNIIKLNKYTNVADLKNAIGKLPYNGGSTNTPSAIFRGINLLSLKQNGGCADPVPNVGIIFTGMLIAGQIHSMPYNVMMDALVIM